MPPTFEPDRKIERTDMTTTQAALFELKVIVEADGWHDVSTLMATVDEALAQHRRSRDSTRRWSVVAAPLPPAQARELLWFITDGDDATDAHADPLAS